MVAGFIDEHSEADRILFCCDAGSSRLPALAAAYMKHLGCEDGCIWDNPYLSPNMLVYRVMMREYGIELTDRECAMLAKRSEDALANAIAASSGSLPAPENA